MAKFEDFLGTIGNAFRVGINGIRIKSNAGILNVRNTADTADAALTASTISASTAQLQINTAAQTLTIKAAAGQTVPLTMTYPANYGSSGQVMTTDGAGNHSYVAAGSTAQCTTTHTTTIAFGTTSPVNWFTMPANAVVEAVRVIVDTPFNGVPSLSIGIAGSTSKYLASNQNDLTQPAATCFEVYPAVPFDASPENIIATFAAGGATVGSARCEIDYVIPLNP